MIKEEILAAIKTRRDTTPTHDVRIIDYSTVEECDYDKITFNLEQDSPCREEIIKKWITPSIPPTEADQDDNLNNAESLIVSAIKSKTGTTISNTESRNLYKDFYDPLPDTEKFTEKTIKRQFTTLSALQYDNEKEVFVSALDGDLVTE